MCEGGVRWQSALRTDSTSLISNFYDDASRRALVPPIHFQGADEDDMEDVTGELEGYKDWQRYLQVQDRRRTVIHHASAESPSTYSSVTSVDGMSCIWQRSSVKYGGSAASLTRYGVSMHHASCLIVFYHVGLVDLLPTPQVLAHRWTICFSAVADCCSVQKETSYLFNFSIQESQWLGHDFIHFF